MWYVQLTEQVRYADKENILAIFCLRSQNKLELSLTIVHSFIYSEE